MDSNDSVAYWIPLDGYHHSLNQQDPLMCVNFVNHFVL